MKNFMFLFFLLLTFSTVATSTYGQAKKTVTSKAAPAKKNSNQKVTSTKRTNTSKTTTKKSTSAVKKADTARDSTKESAKGNASKTKYFEGVLTYESYQNNSKAAIRMSKGMMFNGTHEFILTVKDENIDLYDTYTHFHKVILGDKDMIYEFCDLTKTGVSMKYSDYFASLYDKSKSQASWSFTETQQKKEILGLSFNKHNGVMKMDDKLSADMTRLNMTSNMKESIYINTSYKFHKPYYSIFGNIDSYGLVGETEMESHVNIPIIGKMDTFGKMTLKEIKEKKVSLNDILPSDDIVIEHFENHSKYNSKLVKLYKESGKFLKKNKMDGKEKAKNEEVKYDTKDSWDY